MELTQTTFTVGKYKGHQLPRVLKDRSYCRWLLKQEWFKTAYEYLYNRVKEYDPTVYFIKPCPEGAAGFLETYSYFNLVPPMDVKIELTDDEKACYSYYVATVDDLRARIQAREDKGEVNIFAVKAPVKWLQKFEAETELPRLAFKEFMASYDLPNITYIIEDIKKEGGIEYKGAKAFLIAKERSVKQEEHWEAILKKAYDEDLGTQYKYKDCIFDFLCVPTKTIFECKLGLKDFDEDQYRKYRIALEEYRLVYIIGYDCVIHISAGIIYTTAIGDYELYQQEILMMKHPSKFDELIKDFSVVRIDDLGVLFGYKSSVTHD